jgi:hypothetical protein
MFWDRKILASPCFGRRVELLPMLQGMDRGQQYPRASGQELTLNKQVLKGRAVLCDCEVCAALSLGLLSPLHPI